MRVTSVPSRPRVLSRTRARALLASFDRMQTRYIPTREDRFQVMFDLLEAQLPRGFRALDLGCGPGSLSVRLLRRFPKTRVVALDLDPLLLEVGRRALPDDLRPRLTWVEADLRSPTWVRALPPRTFDAILSTTALHWLSPRTLARLYRDLHGRLRPGGLFLNGDKAPLAEGEPSLRRLTDDAFHHRQDLAGLNRLDGDWQAWWRSVRRDPALRGLYRLRQMRFPGTGDHGHDVSAPKHIRYLRAAGFEEADVVWRDFTNVVLAAIRLK